MTRLVSIALVAVLAVVPAMAGCAKAPASIEGVAVASDAPALGQHGVPVKPALADAINGFGLELLRKAPAGTDGNTVVSPLAVHVALAMTAQGAAGGTADEMRTVLFPAGPAATADQGKAYADLLANLPRSSELTLTVANALWAQKGISFEQPFLTADRDYFGAQIATLDLHAPGAPATMNAWAAKNTNGLITDMVTRVPDNAVLYLTNATYFKARWLAEFEPEATKPAPFHLADGSTADVPTMHQNEGVTGTQTAGFVAARLPFLSDEATGVSAWVLVPEAGRDASQVLASLTAADWRALTATPPTRPAVLSLPKFKVSWGSSLATALAGMGMPGAFDPKRADFTGMTRDPKAQPVFIGDITHDTVLDVNEGGVEAAAVAVVGMQAGASLPAEKPLEVVADRPFLFIVNDDANGEILFAGVIADPRK